MPVAIVMPAWRRHTKRANENPGHKTRKSEGALLQGEEDTENKQRPPPKKNMKKEHSQET